MKVEELHWSDLSKIARSPAHFRSALDRDRDASTPSQLFGRLVHAIVLGGEFVVYEGDRRGKAWSDFKAAHEGQMIVTGSEARRAGEVARAVQEDPVAAPLLAGCETEIAWERTMFGRKCAGRVDAFRPGVLLDLKTSTTTEPRAFSFACRRMGYAGQLAWYREALRLGGARVDDCYIVGVEVQAPFAVTVLHLTPRSLDLAARTNRLWIERLQACEEADFFPAYTQCEVPFDAEETEFSLTIDGETVGFDQEEEAA